MPVGISVVIPCYNAEKFIIRCLESIRNCAYEAMELILVNDCSTDGTENAIKEYLCGIGMPAILISNEVNIGPGISRNRGIAAASKEYITFVDADDEVQPNFFSELDKTLQKERFDCVIFDALMERKKRNSRLNMFYGGHFSEGAIDPKSALVFARGGTWGKIYKTAVIQKNEVRFAKLKRNEDSVFTKTALSWCETVAYLPETLYVYRENDTSLMHNAALLDMNNAYRAYEMIETALSRRGLNEELKAIYMLEVVYSSTMTMIRQNSDNKTCQAHYQKLVSTCDSGNRYLPRFYIKYRLLFWLMKTGQFWLIRKFLPY